MQKLFFLMKRFWWRTDSPTSLRFIQKIVLFGIGLSVMGMLLSLGMIRGFEKEYQERILDFNAHLLVAPDRHFPVTEAAIRKALSSLPSLRGETYQVSPYLLREALFIHQGKIRGVVLKGVPLEKEGLLLGEALAKKIGWKEGEGIKLMIPQGGFSPMTQKWAVAGTFESGIYEIDSQFALIDFKALQALFALSKEETSFEIKISQPTRAPQVAKELQERLGPFASVQSWVDLNRPLFEALTLEKWAFRILMGFIVLVAAFNLIGAILLSIFRKRKSIAMLSALGLPPKQVRFLFASQGLFLGMGGLLLGVFLGLILSILLHSLFPVTIDPEVYFLDRLPMVMEWKDIFMIAVWSFLLIGVTSWWATQTILKLSIREGLHQPGG